MDTKIRQHIVSGELGKALVLLPGQDSTMLLSRHNENERKMGLGIISENDYSLERNRITAAIISLLPEENNSVGNYAHILGNNNSIYQGTSHSHTPTNQSSRSNNPIITGPVNFAIPGDLSEFLAKRRAGTKAEADEVEKVASDILSFFGRMFEEEAFSAIFSPLSRALRALIDCQSLDNTLGVVREINSLIGDIAAYFASRNTENQIQLLYRHAKGATELSDFIDKNTQYLKAYFKDSDGQQIKNWEEAAENALENSNGNAFIAAAALRELKEIWLPYFIKSST